MLKFLTALQKNPIIAAFRDVENLRVENLNYTTVIFILGGTIFDLPAIVQQARERDQMVFVDIDLIKGIGKDASGVRYLAKESRVNGVITTRSNLVKSIQKERMISIQRLFVLDSDSLAGGLGTIEKSAPEAVEILPGLILPKVIDRIREVTSIPVIAGGLIKKEDEAREILASGAVGISTTSSNLFASPRT
ncbi:MAG TPA: glycerol-3-phosphate responsive antiterminator [Syntrophorhabdaceae bacterium]|nr:glycerol-3-phosphate responsive antiterminator [Syntrophorhabdaceae bacterium]